MAAQQILGFLTILVTHGQGAFIYPGAVIPREDKVGTPGDIGLPYEEVNLQTKDGVDLKAYILVQERVVTGHGARHIRTTAATDAEFAKSRPTIFMFHGNAENFGDGIEFASIFYTKMRCNVVMVSYRGYGGCSGKPSEKGITIDSQTVLDYVANHEVLQHSLLILFGISIGGAVAINLASRNPDKVHAVIVENTFLSIPKMLPHVIPALSKFGWLVRDKWRSEEAIKLIPRSTPMLFLSGSKDEVVPPTHMEQLFSIACGRDTSTNQPDVAGETDDRTMVRFPEGTHNTMWNQPLYWKTIKTFVDSVAETRHS